jgi:hypothetical protein
MSELRDFLESVELTDRQKEIYDAVCDAQMRHKRDFVELLEWQGYHNPEEFKENGYWTDYEHLKTLLIEEFTGAKIV